MMKKYPGNGIFVVQGEISILMISMKKFHWSSRSYQENENNPLLKNLSELKGILNQISDLKDIEPSAFLYPFLDVIRSAETSVQVSTLALSSIYKFISYGLISSVDEKYLLPVIETIADVVAHAAHANFIITDDSSGIMILMKIIEVLRTLVLSPLGSQLSNDSICEIMLSCFKICFEIRLNDSLRHSAEFCLKDIVQFLFSRLPLFLQTPADVNISQNQKMRMCTGIKDYKSKKKSKQSAVKITSSIGSSSTLNDHSENSASASSEIPPVISNDQSDLDATLPADSVTSVENPNSNIHVCGELQESGKLEESVNAQASNVGLNDKNGELLVNDMSPDSSHNEKSEKNDVNISSSPTQSEPCMSPDENIHKQYVNSQGVRFMSDDPNLKGWLIAERVPLEPHNSICVQELLRFLALICNPHDKQNTDVMRHISLSLLTIALEVGAEAVSGHPALLTVIKDTLCRNLLYILKADRVPMQIFAATLQVTFLLFESMRTYLKFQVESFLSRLTKIIVSEDLQISYDKKELAIETLVRLWRIPGFITEVYLNYDCGLYCPNLFEEITILFSKSASPVDVIYNSHVLALSALLITVDSIEKHCHNHLPEESISDHLNGDTPIARNIPSTEQLIAIKRRKKLLTSGAQHFNADPKKGIHFLQEQHLLSDPLNPVQVAKFLRENPYLDKKMIGDFLSHRANMRILEEFVKLFDFTDVRIDRALRTFLQSFRLPGESGPMIVIMQNFADHWHDCNRKESLSKDSIFQLAFGTVVLNTLLYNPKLKQSIAPPTPESFKSSLKGENDGKDFDDGLLESIFQSIKNEEIILPDEREGLVRDNYLWELLLNRGAGKNGVYMHAHGAQCDYELFLLCWEPVVSALRFVFDKAVDSSICHMAVHGFRKCAAISAHYGMCNEFDTIIWSLCGFTTLMNSLENPESCTVSFGMNEKARLAARTVFSLVHRHGDTLRDGWRPVFDCIFRLFRCKLLPKILVEAEDFLELSGKISLIREDVTVQKTSESGLLSSLFSYITVSRDASSQRISGEKEKEYIEDAKTCVIECHLENLIQESKFLRLESLHELLKTLIQTCYNDERVIVLNTKHDEDKAVFFLELLIKVVIQNRDRISSVWLLVCEHLHTLLMAAAAVEQQFLMERCVIGLLRLAIRLMRRDEISSSVTQSLQILLLLKWDALYSVSRQISYGLHELLKTGAANIHTEADWSIIFMLLEVVGAGAPLPKPVFIAEDALEIENSTSIDDSSIDKVVDTGSLAFEKQHLSKSDPNLSKSAPTNVIPSCHGYIFHNEAGSRGFYTCEDLLPHDPFSLVKCCETLAFLVRDVAHITPFNFKNCIHAMRTFVEATLFAGEHRNKPKIDAVNKRRAKSKASAIKTKYNSARTQNNPYSSDESDVDEYPDSYFHVPLQLLDLIDTLHKKTAHIHNGWTKPNSDYESHSLWPHGWCPLLQGIARLWCDPREPVRRRAISCLQQALSIHDSQTLKANEWESCFNLVLFPLLELLAEPFDGKDYASVEYMRMSALNLLSRVFRQHLTLLQTLPSFTNLWLRILDFMNRYMTIDKKSDSLNDFVREGVKNMIMVMEINKLFSNDDGQTHFWELTWERVDQFLPNLRNELLKYHSTVRESGDYIPPANSPELPTDNFKEREISKSTSSQENVESKFTEASLVKESVPLFPHMGQLISTPIGPSVCRNVSRGESGAVDVNSTTNCHTQMSSLVASTPDFLASLPSFRAQSPPTIFRNTENRSPLATSAAPPSSVLVLPSNAINVDLPNQGVSAPVASSHPDISTSLSSSPPPPLPSQMIAQCTPAMSYTMLVEQRSYATEDLPYHPSTIGATPVQRSSSVCEATTLTNFRLMTAAGPEISRTESVPVLSPTFTSPSNESVTAIPISCAQPLSPTSQQQQYDISVAQSASYMLPVSNALFAPESKNAAYLVDQSNPQSSPLRMAAALPVYSGFAQLTTDGVRNAEESNAKQFFYQNW